MLSNMTKIYLFQSGVKCRINLRMLDFSAKARKVLRKNRSLIRKANFAVPNHVKTTSYCLHLSGTNNPLVNFVIRYQEDTYPLIFKFIHP